MEQNLIKITNVKIRDNFLFFELYKYKNLILIIFKREFISTYKQTLLGPLWIVLNPIITSFVFTIIFSKVGKISTDQIPPFIFYFSALTIWNYFQNNLNQISIFYITSSSYFRKIYFPRLVIPFVNLLNNSVRFLIQFCVLIAFCCLVYDVKLLINLKSILIIFFLYFYCSIFSLGLGLLINGFTYKYRDLSYLTNYFLTIWLYLSPIAYPISQAPDKLKIILLLNPITSIIELFRFSLFGVGTFDLMSISFSIFFLLFFFILGVFVFLKTERNFTDLV
jgi:lipopolysaccharide transport system permease protein